MQDKMAKTFSMSLLSLCLLLHFFLAKCSKLPLVPAFYIFGDSLVDSGNNNQFSTSAKVKFQPYGVDFPGGATGRFTNGKTTADFIAQFLGLPYVPPYNGLSDVQKSQITTGMNYASGSAGILRETGSALGKNLPLEVQVQLFKETVNNYLPKNFKTKDELLQYLSKSIFGVVIGGNDYINNYLKPDKYNSSHLYNTEQFASILLKGLKQHLQDLYNLGARNFMVFSLSPIGCIPAMKKLKKAAGICADDINELVSPYNKGFPSMIDELSNSLQGSTFVRGNVGIPSLLQDLVDTLHSSPSILEQNNILPGFLNLTPLLKGFITTNPCCVTDSETHQCREGVPACMDRAIHIFWDEIHPTQTVNLLLAVGCFYGSLPCTPVNLSQLAQKLGSASQ